MDDSSRSPACDPVEDLRRRLHATGDLKRVSIPLPRTGRRYAVEQPSDIDALLDEAQFDPEQNLPHWAEVWPSGIALAEAVLAEPELIRNRRVLELGCGLGVTASAALQAGARLTVADYSPGALLLCRYNTRLNAGTEPEAALPLNWRAPSSEFLAHAGDGFDVVLAADVLYESRDLQPLLAIVERLVAPNGMFWLAEPGRSVATRFLELARERGWQGDVRHHPGPWPDPHDEGVTVALYQLKRCLKL